MLNRKVTNSFTVLLLVALVCLTYLFPVPWWSLLIVVLAWFLITLFGSFFIRWNYHLTSKNANAATTENQIAITFDDGPHPQYTPQVLDLLKTYHAKATFFCIGKHMAAHPTIVKRIISEGHLLGNHTYSHSKSFGFFNTTKVKTELQQTIATVQKLTGKTMKLYRPAFGVTNPMIAKAVKELGVISIGWNKRSLDTTSRSKEQILKRITPNLNKGDIVLLHDTSEKSVQVLEQLLLFLQEKKMQSVTADELLQLEAYA